MYSKMSYKDTYNKFNLVFVMEVNLKLKRHLALK